MPVWHPVYIGIGSNLNDPARQVRSGIEQLAKIPDTKRVMVSEMVQSPPLGGGTQPDYVNAVAALVTRLSPESLLKALQQIESDHGRTRSRQRWDSRPLDLDILVYGHQQLATADLTIPHPHLHTRSFVLGPLCELAPDLRIAELGTVRALAAQVDLGELRPVTRNEHGIQIGSA